MVRLLAELQRLGWCNSCTGVVNLDSLFGSGGVFVGGVSLQSGFVGFVGGGADFGGFCLLHSGSVPHSADFWGFCALVGRC